jgi:hypothetical protein
MRSHDDETRIHHLRRFQELFPSDAGIEHDADGDAVTRKARRFSIEGRASRRLHRSDEVRREIEIDAGVLRPRDAVHVREDERLVELLGEREGGIRCGHGRFAEVRRHQDLLFEPHATRPFTKRMPCTTGVAVTAR